METCIRGFSYMPEKRAEVPDSQLIESSELEHTWRARRRQRLKEQEQRIWEEFVNEQDVVEVVSKDDPYQFLKQLPEACLKELLEAELRKTEEEVEQETAESPSPDDESVEPKEEHQSAVPFADEADEDSDIFHIFDDEKDEPPGQTGKAVDSGPDDDVLESTCNNSPVTVRERDSDNESPTTYDRGPEKSPENVSSVIESSIYCAKVKDLRLKIRDEINAIMVTLESQNVTSIDPEQVGRMCRRSAEFSSRFNRIYMYQLRRQMGSLQRSLAPALPFARRTHFHAQLLRVASLHHNLLQAVHVFHKSIEQTACLQDSAGALHALLQAARDVSALAAAVPAPKDLQPAGQLYDDDVLACCDNLDEAVCNHSLRVSAFMNAADSRSQSKVHHKAKGKKKLQSPKSKTSTDTRLSMYSLDALRLNLAGRPGSKNYLTSGTSKQQASATEKKKPLIPKSPKRSSRCRRPLMRAGGRPGVARAAPRDAEISTMVEAVETCSHVSRSRAGSPPRAACAPASARHSNYASPRKSTPRRIAQSPKRQPASPNNRYNPLSPNNSFKPFSPKNNPFNAPSPNNRLIPLSHRSGSYMPHSAVQGEGRDSESCLITPVCRIQCEEKKLGRIESERVDTQGSAAGKAVEKTDGCAAKSNKTNKGEKNKRNQHSKINNDSNSGRRDDAEGSNDLMEGILSCRSDKESSSRERTMGNTAPARCEVTRLLKQLCGGDASGSKADRVSGARNAQLLCINSASPRPPSTPQLLKILENTIQKKVPTPMYPKPKTPRDPARYRMQFNIPEKTTEELFQYRTKFVQHMLESSLYANSAVGKPWEMICSVSDKIIDEILLVCAKEMQLKDIIMDLYDCETK